MYVKKHIRVGTHRIAYYDEGPQVPRALLFLHGVPTSAFLWRKVIQSLIPDYRCVAPDILGLGDTMVGSDEDYAISSQAQVMAAFVEELGIEDLVLVGHDVGGAVAQFMALRQGRRVRGLVLCNSVCYDNWPVGVIRTIRAMASKKWIFDAFMNSGTARRLAYSKRGFRQGVKHPGSLGPKEIDEYLRPIILSPTARQRFRKLAMSLTNNETREIANEFYRLTEPVDVIWGLDDRFLPLIWGERLATDLPASELHTISDCGHFVPEERPRPLARHIRKFLVSRVEAFANQDADDAES